MKIHVLQHAEWETIGKIDEWIISNGYSYSLSKLYLGEELPSFDVDFLIVMGGPMGIYDDSDFPWLKKEREFLKEIVKTEAKILGICLGAQFIVDALGAKVYPGPEKEIGFFEVFNESDNYLTKSIDKTFEAFHWHGDTFEIPEGAERLFSTELTENQGFVYAGRVLALQFHLEVGHKEIEGFVEYGSDEIIPSKYIQRESEIMSIKFDFDKSNLYLFEMLDKLLIG
ncbi:MAG: type 1 glutamine amidotransferase [Flavobacteriales bacterium]|nr:type 1 glutamine amidotransferase [Flavobacteriales bacterium]